MCDEKAKEFNERKMMRANEEAAISQAVAILNSGKLDLIAIPSFVQIASHDQNNAPLRKTVSARLQVEARSMKSLKLAQVAALLELGNPFEAVLKEIGNMLKILDEEQKADDENKEWCEKERDENNKLKDETKDKVDEISNRITELET